MQLYDRSAGEVQCDILMYAALWRRPGDSWDIHLSDRCVYVQTPKMRVKLDQGQAKHV